MSNLTKYIENLKVEFDRAMHDEMKSCYDEETVLYLYAYYHYFNADSSSIPDIVAGNVFSPDSEDKIAGIYIDSDADLDDIDVLTVKFTDNADFDFPAILKRLKDIEAAVFSASEKKSNVRKEVQQMLSGDEYTIGNNRPVKICILTDYNPRNFREKNKIIKYFNLMKPDHENVVYKIIFGYDVEHEILEIEEPKEYVDTAIIQIDDSSNILKFGNEESMIVNISAKSLKEIYELYYYRGLFAQNLRYYVKNSKVDDNIIDSIQNKADNFWYYNNGIIMICDDYIIQDNSILIENFSIINGGQTTKLIGETDFDTDFYIQCKIVKNKYTEENDRIEFIANVAEASNTQKPIKGKDLIANKPEQRLLKKQMAAAGIYCQIKRGEKVNKKLYPAAWQNTTNEELGQFILSFTYQRPGTARGYKSTLCSNAERYSLIFGKTYDTAFLADLLKLKAFYKLWNTKLKKNDDGEDPYKVGLVNNGMFFITAIIGALSKLYFHPEYIDVLNNTVLSEQKLELLSQHDIDHHIFAVVEDYKDNLFALFEFAYERFYRPAYEILKSFKPKYNQFSNFTKVNNNYNTYVIKQINMEFRNGFTEQDRDFLAGILYHPTDEELERDRQVLGKYVNIISKEIDRSTDVSDELAEQIKEALIAYRTKTYKMKRVKAYEVFKNVACDRIAHYAPQTIEELKELRCLDDAQIAHYGEDIIEIIKKVLN